jgi:hypothetical protein
VATAVALVAAALSVILAGPSAAQQTCTIRWDGGTATNWHEPANWTGDRVPARGDVVCLPAGASVRFGFTSLTVEALVGEGSLTIGGGDLAVTGDSELGALTLTGGFARIDGTLETPALAQSGGTVVGTGRLVTGTYLWSGGAQAGSGTTTVRTGGSLAGPGDGRSLSGSRTLVIERDVLVSWTTGDLELRDSARLDNSGQLLIAGDGDMRSSGFSASSIVVNRPEGTIRKTAGSGETVLVSFANQGTLDVLAGTVSLLRVESTGVMAAGPGATLRFAGGSNALAAGSSTTTAGDGRVVGVLHVGGDYGARTVVDGPGTLWFDVPVTLPQLDLRSGNVSGAGSITTNDMRWSGGVMQGDGQTTIRAGGPGLVASGPELRRLERRTLTIEPEATLRVPAGTLTLTASARLLNAGRIELSDATAIDTCCGEMGTLENLAGGVVSKEGPGRAAVTTRFTNAGLVEAGEGTLGLSVLTNLVNGVLTGGRWYVAGTLELPAPLARNAADLTLDGPEAGARTAGADALRAFAANDPGARLVVENAHELVVPAFENRGAVYLGRDAYLASDRYVQHGGSTVLASDGSELASLFALADIRGGVLTGVGTVFGGVVNAGDVRPGLGAGTLRVLGDYEQLAAGGLEIEIGGRGAEARDLLDVSGDARFAGTLRVVTLGEFLPEPADEFEIVRHASVGGGFDPVKGLQIDDAHGYSPPDYATSATWLRSSTLPLVSVADATVAEDGVAEVEIRLSAPSWRPVRMVAATADGTAEAPGDYARTTAVVEFAPGQMAKRVSVPIAADESDEPDEAFELYLGELGGAAPGDTRAAITIADDDPPPPDPTPEPTPDPDPTPTPGPDPDPNPTPDPDPDPNPSPDRDPGPNPSPDPDPDPGPNPDPDPGPGPTPDPGPDPNPNPDPGPDPNPKPDPSPRPDPLPAPDPDPLPSTGPGATPEPGPSPADADRPPSTPVARDGRPDVPSPQLPAEDHASRDIASPAERFTGGPCRDRRAPLSSFRPGRHPLDVSRTALRFRGIAWDRGCGALKRVTVAIARREGGGTGLCRYLQPNGRLGAVVTCRQPTYVKASGTTAWAFTRTGRFAPGTWTARIRAVDRAGNAEKKVRKPNPRSRNFVTFKIR